MLCVDLFSLSPLQWADDKDNIRDKTPIAQIWELYHSSEITGDTLVWQEGMEGWTKWSECHHLFPEAAPAQDEAVVAEVGHPPPFL